MFEHSTREDGWPEKQWAAILFPCLVGPAQQAVETIPLEDVTDYGKVRDHPPDLESKPQGIPEAATGSVLQRWLSPQVAGTKDQGSMLKVASFGSADGGSDGRSSDGGTLHIHPPF